jgi:hypothetical protein
VGLDNAAVEFLCAAKSLGVNFASTATIGRQSFWPGEAVLQRVFSVLGIKRDAEAFLRENRFSETFFALLGATNVTSLDCSSYEAADILHDMNLPIPDDLRGRFSLVHDGGTIEHVFNVYQALKNCMEMVQVGGHFTQVNVANNYMGHGFWQFSPELIFRAFSPANGYQIEAVFLHENVPGGAWYVVSDPDKVNSRVELCNSSPTYIMTVAKRVALVEIFALPPQQSDYIGLWDRTLHPLRQPASNPNARLHSRIVKGAIEGLRDLLCPGQSLKYCLQRFFGHDGVKRGFNRSCYRRVSEEALLHGKLS